ncbi:hypothetical protein [Pandoraea sputorum]|uniref:hypothetical protein n=1 Tax=Pandoraea sputorum TaxID=93222 RepID=UPI00123F6294|nr:hypothetical protein [Pandoraea sputorum]
MPALIDFARRLHGLSGQEVAGAATRAAALDTSYEIVSPSAQKLGCAASSARATQQAVVKNHRFAAMSARRHAFADGNMPRHALATLVHR